MGLSITLFTGLTAIQGIMTKSADDMLMRTARYSLDNLIPLVGGFTADSLEMIIACLKSIRGGIGVAGVIILVLLLIGPLVKSVCVVLIFRATSLVLEPAGDDAMSDCMGELASAATVMAALLFLSSLMFVIFFTVCFASFRLSDAPARKRANAKERTAAMRINVPRNFCGGENLTDDGRNDRGKER